MADLQAQGQYVLIEFANTPYQHMFRCFTQDWACQLLIHYVMLGFELELYSSKELPVVYWSARAALRCALRAHSAAAAAVCSGIWICCSTTA